MSDLVAGTIIAIGLFIWGIAAAVATTATDSVHFTGARALVFIGAVLLFGPILFYIWTTNQSVAFRAVVLGSFGAISVVGVFISIVWFDGLEMKNTPKLFPGDGADPVHSACKFIPVGALKTFFGSNVAWSTSFPHTVLRMKGDDMLVMDQDKSGALVIKTLRIFDANGVSIARFDDGEIWNSGDIRTKKPNKSTFVVYDKSDAEIMRVTFLNQKSLEITGTFFNPSGAKVVITDSKAIIGGVTISGNCLGNSRADIVVQ